MKTKFSNYMPIGIVKTKVYSIIFIQYFVAITYSFSYFYEFKLAKVEQMKQSNLQNILVPIDDFSKIISGTFILFPIAIVGCFALAIYFYSYHYQGSKSIYTMKRLSSKTELWKRVLVIPIFYGLLLLIIVFVLLFLYFQYYKNMSPVGSINPDQCTSFISMIYHAIN